MVVLAHAADRTGPPMYLLELLRRLPRARLELHVVLLRGGELEVPLADLARVYVVGEPVDPQRASASRLADEPRREEERRQLLAHLEEIDVVMVNTAWSIHALDYLPPTDAPVLSVVHELDAGIGGILSASALDALLLSDRFLVGCRAVGDLLTGHYEVPADRIDLVPYGIDLAAEASNGLLSREGIGIEEKEFLVVTAAVPVWRKGPDLFVHLASAARRRRPELPWRFIWIGADHDSDGTSLDLAVEDCRLLEAEDLVRFLPSTPDLRSHLRLADVFVLCSREDAFPLVGLEAAAAGLPIVCFDTGGLPDLVGDDTGTVVAFPQLDTMADVLIALQDDPSRRQRLGQSARARVYRDHDIERHVAGVAEVLERMLAGPTPSPMTP